MPNIITLLCPTCGGKLKVSPNATMLTCQFCGNEHMVKHEAGGAVSLEAYARCPVCGRNDKAEKVSAILVSQTQEISGVEQKQELVGAPGQQRLVTKDVPFTRKQVSVLGQRLQPPEPPDPSRFPPFPRPPRPPSKGGLVALLVIGIVEVIIATTCCLLSFTMFAASTQTYSSQDAVTLSSTGLIILLGSGMLLLVGAAMAVGGIVLLGRRGKPDPTLGARYQQQVEAVQREHERIRKGHETAIERWNQLYYCSRDDCVFIPGENTSAPLARMGAYLHPPEALPPAA